MGRTRPHKGEIRLKKPKIDELALELRKWYIQDHPEVILVKEFSVSKNIPFHYFTGEFIEKSSLMRETMYLCMDVQEVRFINAMKDKKLPQNAFSIFAAKNVLNWRDKEPSAKKDQIKKQPSKSAVKEAILGTKEKFFQRPE